MRDHDERHCGGRVKKQDATAVPVSKQELADETLKACKTKEEVNKTENMPVSREECAVLLEHPSEENLTLDGKSKSLRKVTSLNENPHPTKGTTSIRRSWDIDPTRSTTSTHGAWDLDPSTSMASVRTEREPDSTTGTISNPGFGDRNHCKSTTSMRGRCDPDSTRGTTSIYGSWDPRPTKSITSAYRAWDPQLSKGTTGIHRGRESCPIIGTTRTRGDRGADPITGMASTYGAWDTESTSTHGRAWDPKARFMVGRGGELFVGDKDKMAAVSPIFEAMFRGPWSEDNDIHIPDVQPEAFRLLLGYADTGVVSKLNRHNVWDVLMAADKYQVAPLVRHCFHHLLHLHPHRHHPRHLCVVMETAHHLHYRQEYTQCLEEVLKHGGKVLTSVSCLAQLCHDCLLHIVRADHLQGVDDEVVVYKAVLTWTTSRCGQGASWEELRHMARDLLYQVRYLTLPTPILTRLLESPTSSSALKGPASGIHESRKSPNLLECPKSPNIFECPKFPGLLEGPKPPDLLKSLISPGSLEGPKSPSLLENPKSPGLLEGPKSPDLPEGSNSPGILESPKFLNVLESPKHPSLLKFPKFPSLLKGPKFPRLLKGLTPSSLLEVPTFPCLLSKDEVEDLLHHSGSRFPPTVRERRNQTPQKAETGGRDKKTLAVSRRGKNMLWCALICLVILLTFVIQYFFIRFVILPVTQMMEESNAQADCTNRTHCD